MHTYLFAIFLILIFGAGCANEKPVHNRSENDKPQVHVHKEDEHDHHHHHHHDHDHNHDEEHDHAHVFYCLLHEEVESEEPGICPKCGTELEFLENENMERYGVTLTTQPENITPSKSINLQLKPYLVNHKNMRFSTGNEQLVITDDQLNFLDIPQLKKDNYGTFHTDYTFPAAGNYYMFFSYQPKGTNTKFSRHEILLAGRSNAITAKPKVNYTWSNEDLKLKLITGKPFEFNISTLLKIESAGHEGETIALHDAEMHIISYSLKRYPFINRLRSEKENVMPAFHTVFPERGFYKIFVLFTHNNKRQQANFTVEITR